MHGREWATTQNKTYLIDVVLQLANVALTRESFFFHSDHNT